jgi:hypothetical protein
MKSKADRACEAYKAAEATGDKAKIEEAWIAWGKALDEENYESPFAVLLKDWWRDKPNKINT